MEFVDEEDHEEEDAIPITTFDPLKMPPIHSSSSSPPPSPLSLSIPPPRSLNPLPLPECQMNHAVGIPGNAVDGCGEFMSACAACGCHRKEPQPDPEPAQPHQPVVAPIAFYPQHPPTGPGGFQFPAYGRQRPLMSSSMCCGCLPRREPEREWEMMMISNPMAAMGLGSSGKKRYRTKFTDIE